MQNSVQVNLGKVGVGDAKSNRTDDNLFISTRGLLVFGKVIGLLPYKGVLSKSSENLSFSSFNAPAVISYILILILTFNSVLECLLSATASKKNAYEIAQSIRNTLYYVWGTVIYVNFVVRANTFLNIFHAWRSCSVVFSKADLHLKRDTILISAVVLTSGILENSTLYMTYVQQLLFPKNDPTQRTSTLELYYIQSHPSWAKFISYNPVFAVLAFLQHKLILLSWNFMDILIALLGRALYFKFKSLCESAEETLVKPMRGKRSKSADNSKTLRAQDTQGWIQITKDHRTLCDLLQAFETFLSPLIFISYMVNIYYICMQLLDGLTVDLDSANTWTEAVNKPWSFIHLIVRIYMISIWCARVNMYAHEIRNILYECPADSYNTDISRLEKRVSGSREIGFTGLGCFTVTKPFILTFIGVIFTFEIVLLQVIPSASQTAGGGQKC